MATEIKAKYSASVAGVVSTVVSALGAIFGR